MGVGMVAVVAPDSCERTLRLLAQRGVPSWVLGEIIPGSGEARLTGRHPA